MANFNFSFVIKPEGGRAFTKHLKFEEEGDRIVISCDTPDSECVHHLEAADGPAFNKEIGLPETMTVLEAVKIAVQAGIGAYVDVVVHEVVKPVFVWYDQDSSFYGD